MTFRVASAYLGDWYFYLGHRPTNVTRIADVSWCVAASVSATQKSQLLCPSGIVIRTWRVAHNPAERVNLAPLHLVADEIAGFHSAVLRHVGEAGLSKSDLYPGEIAITGATELSDSSGVQQFVDNACRLTILHDGRDITASLCTYTDAWLDYGLSRESQQLIAEYNRPKLRHGLQALAAALGSDIDPGPATRYAQPTSDGLENHQYELGVYFPGIDPNHRQNL